MRDGDELGRASLHPAAGSPSPARFEVDGIDTNDVIDVTFINPNDEAVICSTCMVWVSRQVRTSTTRMSTEMFLRAFNGAVASLAPMITAVDGKVRVSLHGELAHELGLHTITEDLPVSFSGAATFEARELEIMGLHEMIRQVIVLFQHRVGQKAVAVRQDTDEYDILDMRRKTHVDVHAFIDAVADAYFDPQTLFNEVVLQRVTPPQIRAVGFGTV